MGTLSEVTSEGTSEPTENGACLLSLEAQPFKPGELLLQSFQDFFENPQQLPPSRTHDHGILLRDVTDAINIR